MQYRFLKPCASDTIWWIWCTLRNYHSILDLRLYGVHLVSEVLSAYQLFPKGVYNSVQMRPQRMGNESCENERGNIG